MRTTVFPTAALEMSREAWFPMTVSIGQTLVTKPSMLRENVGVTTIRRAVTSSRDAKRQQLVRIVHDNTVIGPALDAQETIQHGTHFVEININSLRFENTVSLMVISRGLDGYLNTTYGRKHKFNEFVAIHQRFPKFGHLRTGNDARVCSQIHSQLHRFTLQTERKMLQLEMVFNLHWRQQITLCEWQIIQDHSKDCKNCRKHTLWKLFRASAVWRTSQGNRILLLQWMTY